MTIPCEECLVLAACRNKTKISCLLLYNWMIRNRVLGGKTILKYLPSWSRITKKTPSTSIPKDYMYRIDNDTSGIFYTIRSFCGKL